MSGNKSIREDRTSVSIEATRLEATRKDALLKTDITPKSGPLPKTVYELVDFSDEEHDLSLAAINEFAVELDRPDGEPMTHPVIALSSKEIIWGQVGIHTGDKFGLVLDLETPTMGALDKITPLQLGYSLFDPDVREQITHALINAMAWIKHAETRSLNRYNNGEILEFFSIVQDTFVRNVAKHLARYYDRPVHKSGF
jgi:hypothetical protein